MESPVQQIHKLGIILQLLDFGCLFQTAAIANIVHKLILNQFAQSNPIELSGLFSDMPMD